MCTHTGACLGTLHSVEMRPPTPHLDPLATICPEDILPYLPALLGCTRPGPVREGWDRIWRQRGGATFPGGVAHCRLCHAFIYLLISIVNQGMATGGCFPNAWDTESSLGFSKRRTLCLTVLKGGEEPRCSLWPLNSKSPQPNLPPSPLFTVHFPTC